MKTYLVSYINRQSRKKEYKISFKTSALKEHFIYRKKSEGCYNIKVEPIRTSEYDRSLEREILLKKKEYFNSICIYALIDNNEVVYIGQSSDVMGRLSSHKSSSKKFTHFAIVERISVDDIDSNGTCYVNEREMYYIKSLRPKYNKAGNSGKRSAKKIGKEYLLKLPHQAYQKKSKRPMKRIKTD